MFNLFNWIKKVFTKKQEPAPIIAKEDNKKRGRKKKPVK